MKAWGKSLDESKKIRFLADPSGEFTRAWDFEFDAAKFLGNNRSKRYAVLTENGKVTKVAVEPDNTGITSKFCVQGPLSAILTKLSLCCRQSVVDTSHLTEGRSWSMECSSSTTKNHKVINACNNEAG